jgi:putative addiction module component (TIGR02574 family)
MTEPRDVVAAALALPRDERADLAHKLLVSLDEPFDDPEVVEAEWNAEILRRLRDIESGATEGIPMEEVFKKYER